MKNILIATDFSPAARSATRYGIRLAAALNAKVSFATAYEPLPVPVDETPAIVNPDDMQDVVMDQLHGEAELFATPGAPRIEVYSREGPSSESILATAKDMHANLIIAGMKEHGKGLRRLFGSTVTGLAKKTDLPFLVVPEGTEYKAPSRIVIANDYMPNAEITIPPFLRFLAAELKATITVIRFLGDRAAEVIELLDYSSHLRRVTGVISPLEVLPSTGYATDKLIAYLAGHGSDLLVMSVHHQSLAERWLGGNPAREMMFTTRVPFLLIPENCWH